ncbi:asparaginyl-tRNA synthetase [Marasmius crinis-equi]|uniref:asparagine--tRNA ligase n=1 Tax=Marasmius crinis-equi TaxID=585013 RepID=A0ABR3FKG3_9AGAR
MRATLLRRHFSSSTYTLPPTIRQLLAPAAVGKGSQTATSTNEDADVTVTGWVKSVRRQKRVSFAVISDGTTSAGLQAVFPNSSLLPKELSNGASVKLTGRLGKSPGAGQEKELLVEDVKILGSCDPEAYPIQKQALSHEFLRDNVHLRARTASIAAMLRIRHALQRELSSYFEQQGFLHVHTPILTSNDAEGAGETFKLAKTAEKEPTPASTPLPEHHDEFFGRPAHLTVSAQLHLEAFQAAMGRVWTLSPTFRAERSQTSRHLSEFWMLEAEWGDLPVGVAGNDHTSGVRGICTFVEGMLRAAVSNALLVPGSKEDIDVSWVSSMDEKSELQKKRRQELEKAILNEERWKIMTYGEAILALEEEYARQLREGGVQFEFKPGWGKSLQSEHEKWLAEVFVGGPVFVTDYPVDLKPFYMRLNEADGDRQTVACFDLLVPGIGELVGGSVREEREEVLLRRMKESGLWDEEKGLGDYEWYMDLRRYGGSPHVGFGMGFERLISWVGGIENVRECVPMPRWAGRLLL